MGAPPTNALDTAPLSIGANVYKGPVTFPRTNLQFLQESLPLRKIQLFPYLAEYSTSHPSSPTLPLLHDLDLNLRLVP